MKKSSLLVAATLVLMGCDRKPGTDDDDRRAKRSSDDDDAAKPSPSAQKAAAIKSGIAFFKAIKAQRSSLGVTDLKLLNEKTDPNELLGRPGQYVVKAVWKVQGEAATVEFFPTLEGARNRAEYIREIGQRVPMMLEYVFLNEKRRAVLRVPKKLTPTQAEAWATFTKEL